MKIEAARVDAFLQNPGRCRAILLFGEDEGLIRHRSSVIVRAMLGAHDDPFRMADLDMTSAGRLGEEAAAQSLSGGRRVVRVRDATDALTKTVQGILDHPGESLLILEGPGLPARSRLRSLLEADPAGAAIGCYAPTEASLAATIRDVLKAQSNTIESDAVQWLVGQLGADRGCTAQELMKLAVFAGPGVRIDAATAAAAVGDGAVLSVDDAVHAVTRGDVAGVDRAVDIALAEGVAAVALIRSALAHVLRVHRGAVAVAAGAGSLDVTRSVRPPIFFKRVPDFVAALERWPVASLAAAAQTLSEAERACKSTGAPAELICRNAFLTIARRAPRIPTRERVSGLGQERD